MPVLVTEAGFGPDDWTAGFRTLEELEADGVSQDALAIDFPNDRDPALLARWLDRVALVRITWPATGDGRGFSVAQGFRAMGFTGRLRAAGPLIADQFRMARRVGFDEVELPDAIAERQPEAQWRLRPQGSYQERLTS